MCRFVAYLGKTDILLGELLEKPENSLISQSRQAQKDTHNINADGFGLAWYNKEVSPEAGIFRSTQPAWNNSNLRHLSSKVKSNCFLGHVRDSTVGDVTVNNCHPFAYQQYSFVHNGTIAHFEKVRRALMQELDDEIFSKVKAQTDSEHLFFLIMQFLKNDPNHSLEQAVLKTFQWIVNFQEKSDAEHFSRLNIVITDGEELISTRFVTKEQPAFSLYYAVGKTLKLSSAVPKMVGGSTQNTVIVASEPLTDCGQGWQEVPVNHYLIKKPNESLACKAFSLL